MTIVQQGSINTTALVVPNLYVQIVAPQTLNLNGVPTNVVGMVGTAAWGPVNTATLVGSMADYQKLFGPPQNRKYDMGTHVATANQQGAANFRCVRVTDGTDVAAGRQFNQGSSTYSLGTASRYSGTLGNNITFTMSAGSAASTYKFVIGMPGRTPEVFDNIGGAGAAFWLNAVAAINGGNAVRGPSQFIVATPGTGANASIDPSTLTLPMAVTLAGGTDGTTTITGAVLQGADATPRTGMYALRGQGCSIALLADADVGTTWTTQVAFGLAEGIYFILTGASGDTIANAISTKASAGLDSYAAKLMFGDWLYWQDPFNNTRRVVSPQGFVAGRLANLSPEQSSLNKPLYGVIGSQKSGLPGSGTTNVYSDAELQTLFQAGIDVIANPQPGGNYWGARLGHNSSSNPAVSGDNYTRMTNYLASTVNAGMGLFVGEVINTTLFQRIRATLNAFFYGMLSQGLLAYNIDGSLPYTVVCDATNNPQSRTSLGYVQADCQVTYQGINEKFIVNLEGGATVVTAQRAA